MIKKLFFFVFCIALLYNINAMEKLSKRSKKKEKARELISIADLLPPELIIPVIRYETDSDSAIEFNNGKTSCIQFGPRKMFNQESNEVTLYSKGQWVASINLHPGEWIPSISLNPAEILSTNAKNNKAYCLFSVQCWHKDITEFDHYSKTTYKIDDDIQKKRFIASASLKISKHFFDGPNKEGIFIIGGNSTHEEWTTEEQNSGEKKERKGIFSFLGFGGEKQPKPVTIKKKVYEYYLGKFTPAGAQLYTEKTFKQEDNIFDFMSPRIVGTLTALALCNTRNYNPEKPADNKHHYALVDDEGISIYEIEEYNGESSSKEQENHENKFSIKRIGFGLSEIHTHDLDKENPGIKIPVQLKKISFITPNTLLGISEGALLSIALDKELGTITLNPQIIKNNDGKELFLHTFALNPCDPHQLLLCTKKDHDDQKENQLLYLNLRNCNKPNKREPGKLLIALDETPDSLWFYDSRICLGGGEPLKTINYSFFLPDLTIQKD